MSDRLREVNPQLYGRVRRVLEQNKAQRHIRGGIATRNKYLHNPHPEERAAGAQEPERTLGKRRDGQA